MRFFPDDRTIWIIIWDNLVETKFAVLFVSCLMTIAIGVIEYGWAHGYQEGFGNFVLIIILLFLLITSDIVN